LFTETSAGPNKKNARLLVIEDEPSIREFLTTHLERKGYEVQTAADGRKGLQAFYSWRPDLLLLDIVMPEIDGWEVLARLRATSQVPVMMLTALGMPHQKVRGLEEGADDYVTKPIALAEFTARVQSLLRRGIKPEFEEPYHDEVLSIDFQGHQVIKNGRHVELSPTEFRLLVILVKDKGIPVSPGRLLELCWDDGSGKQNGLRVYISHLRRKIGKDDHGRELLETVTGIGYRYRGQQE